MSKRRSHARGRPDGRGQGGGDAAADDVSRNDPEVGQGQEDDMTQEGELEETMAKRTTPLRQDVQRIGDDFRRLGGHAKELAQDATMYARERAAAVPDVTRTFIQDRPLQSLAIAVGIGALLGLLLFRRD